MAPPGTEAVGWRSAAQGRVEVDGRGQRELDKGGCVGAAQGWVEGSWPRDGGGLFQGWPSPKLLQEGSPSKPWL